MPFTPFHFGAVLWLYYASRKRVDALALGISSIVIDIEPVVKLWLDLPDKHGFFHSYFAVIILSVPISLLLWTIQRKAPGFSRSCYELLLLRPPSSRVSFVGIFGASLVGGVSHVFLDSFTHMTFKFTFYPLLLSPNPFWLGIGVARTVQIAAVVLSIVSLILAVLDARAGRGRVIRC